LKTISEPAAISASEATKKLLQQKKISKKFNYDVLDSLLESQPIESLAEIIEHATQT